MKLALVATALMITSLTAFAGKAERDYLANEVNPAVQEAQTKLKSSCGCAVNVTIDESANKTKDDLLGVKHMAEHVSEGAEHYCTDAASKKAVCQLKTLTFAKAKPAGFTFKGGNGVMKYDGQSTCSWEQVTRELDK